MPDDFLAQLSARWHETGDPADEARVLLERVRVGQLPRRRLQLAAYLGHDAARLALPDSGQTNRPDDPKRLATELWPWGKEASVAAAVSAVHLTMDEPPWDARAQRALEAAAAWVHGPTPETAAAASSASAAAFEAAGISNPLMTPGEARLPALAAHHAAAAAAATLVPVATKHAYRAIKYAQALVVHRLGRMTSTAMRDVMGAALVRWALGPSHVAPTRA